MPNSAVTSERKRAVFSVVLTLGAIPLIILAFLQGAPVVALVFCVAFMLGYVFERIQLLRKVTALVHEVESLHSAVQGRT
jgi:hypothetical protein